ncbi:hypothetical protein [Pseudobacillus badius]|uniref:hypothetical protein n=1 Tax=Bacillus badius TaxID=1455 RepID=UPI000F746A0A|nr:hypothetical protein [Bacillus badius]UAT29862.1 hypothetical protein K7T73_14895 [Bacillus badius]
MCIEERIGEGTANWRNSPRLKKGNDMFVRLYANAQNKKEAQRALNKFLHIFNPLIKEAKLLTIEPYWKIRDLYVIEIEIKAAKNDTKKTLNEVLASISDHWLEFGEPVNEWIASSTDDNCNFMLSEFNMVNIHFDG